MKRGLAIFIAWLLAIHSPANAQGYPTGGSQSGAYSSGGDEKAPYSILVNASWNIVSVPRAVTDYAKTSIFPTAISSAFAFQGTYVPRDTLDNGVGYWLKFPSDQSIVLEGGSISRDTIGVLPGWNLLGSISNAIATSSIATIGTTIRSPFYGYGSTGYNPSLSIQPGKGYWVKVDSSGQIVFSSDGALSKKGIPSFDLGKLSRLIITEADGNRRVLYFGSQAEAPVNPEYFELPPPPPSGEFYVHFASNRFVEIAPEGVTRECPVLFSSAHYPITVGWDIHNGDLATTLAIGEQAHRLRETGEIQVTDSRSLVVLRFSGAPGLPKEYGLAQNYPNPFNPSTTIRYQLPIESHVTLKIFSILGQELRTIVDGIQPAGYKSVVWDSRNESGNTVASGVYFYQINATGTKTDRNFTEVKKMMILK